MRHCITQDFPGKLSYRDLTSQNNHKKAPKIHNYFTFRFVASLFGVFSVPVFFAHSLRIILPSLAHSLIHPEFVFSRQLM